jgi:hypothetical protein
MTSEPEDESGGRVILGAFPSARETDIERPKTYKPHCQHRQYKVSAEDRTVACGGCGSALDPFAVLYEYAHNEREWMQWSKQAREARLEVHKAQEELRRVKALTRSHSKKDAEVAVAAERKRQTESHQRAMWRLGQIQELAATVMRHLGDPDPRERVPPVSVHSVEVPMPVEP